MADYLSAELTATCAVLGYFDGTDYHLDKNCLDVIKDLIRYLRRDDDTHTIRRFLGRTKLLQTDLVKIFIHHVKYTELWDVLLRLLINLTSSTFVIYNEQIPTEKTMYSLYQQINSHLQEYKAALTDENVWLTVAGRLGKLLNIDSTERGEENELTLERILVFIRNVLQVPPNDNDKRGDNDATVHDEILFAFHASGIVDILLFIVSNNKEQQYHMQILEIISLMLREQNASQLAASGLQRSTAEKENDEAKLVALRKKELHEKMDKIKKYAGSRHSRFGGTYIVRNMKATGENQMICHKPYQKIETLEFGHNKKRVKRRKDKMGVQDAKVERTSVLSVRLFLKEFCVEFLSGAYNPVMKFARSCIINVTHDEASETTSYLWALRFFMEFNRHYKFEVKYVSETISTEVFYLVQRQMEQYYEMMITDKKKIPLWSRRLHLALKAYQELLNTLMVMDKSIDHGVKESSKIIKSNIFYVPEYRETILSQLLCFDETKMSRQYLVDLITTLHIFLKMLEHFCQKGQRHLVVQQTKLKRKKAKKRKKPVHQENATPAPTLEERWDIIGPELSAIMRDAVIPEMIPFDATLDTPIDDQKSDAMKKIQKLMRQRNLEQALGLLRAAREIWSENDCFGRADMPPEEEFLALREIFLADLGVIEDQHVTQEVNETSVNHESEEEENDEEDEGETIFHETDFKLDEFLQRFANVKAVKALTLLLQKFEDNTVEVNHYVIKMLHRIAWDCKMPAMIFQASIFRIFQRIFKSKDPAHKELQKFAVFIIRRFIEVAQKNRKSYMELLFWKTTRDATEIVDGYNAETSNKKVSRAVWTEVEEDELRALFMEHQTNKYPQDLIDWLLEHIINENRTRRTIIKKLKEMSLIVNSKNVRAEVQKRLPKEWSEEEITQLTELWTQFKDDDDPVDLIFTGLRIKRPKPKIKEKLLELGLAQDRKELRKKRARKSNQGKSSWETQAASNSDGNESSATDDEDDEETRKSSKRGGAPRRNEESTKKKQRNRRKLPTIVYTDAQLSALLKDVIDRDMREPLEWLKESLQDILDDRDEESSEGIPLVPLTDYSSTAMDSPSFQKLLRALGFVPPADAQESYWRMPANMLTATIQKRYKLIEDVLAGKFIVEETRAESRKNHSDTDEKMDDSGDDVDVFENVKRFFAPTEPEPSTSKQLKPRIKIQLSQESKELQLNEESDEAEVAEKSNEAKVTEKNNEAEVAKETNEGNARNRVRMFDDSSDSEIEIQRDIDGKNDDTKRDRSDSSDTDKPSSKKRRLLDSDEESSKDDNAKTNGSHVIISDDEESPLSNVSSDRPKLSRVIISDEED
ncbi:protein timeless homolog [Cataglyphis hispanica]|uniref:protein timeless homolog n=1 Tax=Cataglyphis hispanica TaxID=1086592 RepID=UPI0021802FFA|nr:protein timeless homolog [Cataglyphis hispanica]XP_050450904.1 protein timeless homolog [Cataglyphis hispanica]XP_050450905.1 protein timeless homolog [Cataglyphis hispanica]XP_050450906.1 protein timeless homolog [Cataglyphis hispanica]